MTLRVAQRGRNAGASFWGCAHFPACRGSRDVIDERDAEADKTLEGPPPPGPRRAGLRVGGFVWTYDRALLGKVIALGPRRARVRIVHSASQHEEREYERAQLKPALLPPHTRVYVWDPTRDVWVAGRVNMHDHARGDDELIYVVRFPGSLTLDVPERALEARGFAPTVDPTETLATGGLESQFFHDRRLAVLRASVEAQTASVGVSGLVAGSVELVPHQSHVVRRVSEDLVQRYLLADEVGLGKTIEAAAVTAQLLAERPLSRVAVVAPTTLLRQWERELREKFDIDDERADVSFVEAADLEELDHEETALDLLIVDEAHHLVPRGGAAHDNYAALARVAHRAERLLLLTATPVLGDDAATLALLHLLDPATYALDDIDGFRSRAERRERYGELVLALDPSAAIPLLRPTVEEIAELLRDDPEVDSACAAALDADLAREERQAAIHTLRHLISDTYRLEHRLIRTRRADTGWAERSCPVTAVEVDEDPRVADAALLLEEWRSAAAAAATPDREAALARLYGEFLEAMGRGITEYASALRSRRAALEAGAHEAHAGESVWVHDSLATCERDEDAMSRADVCVTSIELALASLARRPGDRSPRIVAFTSSTAFADELAAGLRSLRNTVVAAVTANLDEAAVDVAVTRFVESQRPAVLVADRSAEEGLNLQEADALVLTDLPLAPDRLEQRIGRLDRMGRRHPDIPVRVVIPSDEDDSPWLAWHELLSSGFGIYSRSISDVHFLLDELGDRIRMALFRRGAAGLTDLEADVREALTRERRVQDRRHALDQLDLESSDTREAFERLEAAEARSDQYGRALSRWLFDVLNFGRRDLSTGVFRVWWGRRTQVPEEAGWRERFEPALDRPLTFDRERALADPEVRVVRPGFTLAAETMRLMRRDDRGTAFATWRADRRWPANAGEWLGFRLTYVVEVDDDHLREPGDADPSLPFTVIRSAADALFPPWVETRDYDANLRLVTDPTLVDILRRPYDPGTDINLAERRDLIETAVGRNRLAGLCREVRARSEELLRGEERFTAKLQSARTRALQTLAARQARLERRQRALETLGEGDPALDRIRMVERALGKVVVSPRLRLEAIGLFVVSLERPQSEAGRPWR